MLLSKAREQIQKNNYPSEFYPDDWKNHIISNCYCYALDLKLSDCFLIGDFINKRVTHQDSDDRILSVLVEELEALGFDVEEIETDTVCERYSQKIFLGRDSDGDYHFIRQDADGLWSHKASHFPPNRKDSGGFAILDPDMACTNYVVGWCFQLTKKEQ